MFYNLGARSNVVYFRKRVCIMLFVGDASMCGSDAANLYMKAINMETPDTVQEAAAQCTGRLRDCMRIHRGELGIRTP